MGSGRRGRSRLDQRGPCGGVEPVAGIASRGKKDDRNPSVSARAHVHERVCACGVSGERTHSRLGEISILCVNIPNRVSDRG